MNRLSLFSYPGKTGSNKGVWLKVGRRRSTEAKSRAMRSHSSHYLASVNQSANLNLDSEVAYSCEPSTCPQVLLSPGSYSYGKTTTRNDARLSAEHLRSQVTRLGL